MPTRNIVFSRGQVYHVFNKTIDNRLVFNNKYVNRRFLDTLWFFQFTKHRSSYSHYLTLKTEWRAIYEQSLESQPRKVEVLAYCLMTNHYHLLLREAVCGGISKYIGDLQNSITRYSNLRIKRKGPTFLSQFKAKLVETDDQLLHVSRYIHLNPYTAFAIKNYEEIFSYPWSSIREYQATYSGRPTCKTEWIKYFFKTPNAYELFLLDNADYQRKLGAIRHLLFEEKPEV